MPQGLQTDSSLVHASKAARVVLESAAAPLPSPVECAHSTSSLHSPPHPYQAAPATGTAGAAAGKTVDHFQDKDTTRSCSPPTKGQNSNNSSSGLNNNNNKGEIMKCLSAIDYNMKANERYVLLNKNTFQEIFDATLYEMTGAAASVSPPRPTEDYNREGTPLRSGGTRSHCTRDYGKNWSPECSGVYTMESRGKKTTADVSSCGGRRKSDLFLCQTTQDSEPTAQHNVSASPGMLCTETGGAERGAQSILTSRMTALNDITNDHHHGSLASNIRGIPSATESAAPAHFLPPMSPLDNESENEPLDLSVSCRAASKTSSSQSSSSSGESSAPGSPINLAFSDNNRRSAGEVRSSFTATATTASEHGHDKNSLSDSDEDEEIDLGVEVVSTGRVSVGVGSNAGGSTGPCVSATETEEQRSSPRSVVCKHSASDERAAGRGRAAATDCCWQPTSNAPSEPTSSCHHHRLPRGAAGATINTKQARSIGDEIPVDPSTMRCSSVDTTAERDGSTTTTERKSSTTGGTREMASPRMKPQAFEKWGAFSKVTLNNLVEEMVMKMDEEENSEASRSPQPSKLRKSDSSIGDRENSTSGNNISGNVPSTSNAETRSMTSSPGKSAGRPRYNNTSSNTLTVMQSYDQSLSQASELSASQQQQSPKQSVSAPNLPQLVKPGSKSEGKTAPTDLVVSGTPSEKHSSSSERGKQCWVALNKMVVLDIVETEILSEAKENNNNITEGGQDNDGSRSTSPDSVSSRNTSENQDDLGSNSRNRASGCNSQDNGTNKSRKRKCDSPPSASSSNASTPTSGKYVEQTLKDMPSNFERVAMNESCAVPKRPRSSDCASGDINTDVLPTKQRRKSAEINRCYSAETYFDGNRQTNNRFYTKSFTTPGKEGKEGRSSLAAKEWESQVAARQAHHERMSPYYYNRAVTAGQPRTTAGREGHRSEGAAADRKGSRARGTPSPPSDSGMRKSSPTTSLSLQHSGGSPVHDLSMNNVSSITHLVQSQRTTIDYGSNEILAAKQASSIKLGLHSTTSPAHQAPAAIRSRCGVSVNNQYALSDIRENNGDREMRRKRTKVDSISSSPTNNTNEPMTSARIGLDACKAVSLFSTNERSDLTRDARSSPRLGWIAVSKADVQGLFNSVVDSMIGDAAEEPVASPQKPAEEGQTSSKPRSASASGSPAPPSGRSGSPYASSLGTNSAGSTPQRQQIDCENGSNRLENESIGACSPPPPSDKTSFIRTQSPSSSSDNLDSEHIIVDPGSPGDMFLDGEGKDSKSSKHKTFKWKSNLLKRVHEESQTNPLGSNNKKEVGSNRSSPSSESGSEKGEKGLGHSSSTTSLIEEARGQGQSQGRHTSSRSSRRSGKKGNSHSHARAK